MQKIILMITTIIIITIIIIIIIIIIIWTGTYGGEVSSNYSFCRPDCPLQSVPVVFGCRSKPDSDGSAENRLYDRSVELDQQVELPEL